MQTKSLISPTLTAVLALAFLAAPAIGQTTAPGLTATDYEMKIANLERQLQSLRDENAALRQALTAASKGAAAATASAAPVASVAPAPPAESAERIQRSAALQAEIEKETALQTSIAAKMAAQEKAWLPDAFGRKKIGMSEADKNKLRAQVERAIAESQARQAAHEAALKVLAQTR